MIDLETAATALYGNSEVAAAAPVVDQAETPAPADAVAETAAPKAAVETPSDNKDEKTASNSDIPESIQKLRSGDTARQLYSAQQTYKPVLPDDLFAEAEGVPDEVKTAAVAELREICADIGLSNADVTELRNRIGIVKTEALPADTMQEQCITRFNEVFGNDAKQAYRDMVALVKRDPRVGQLLNGYGLGNDAETAIKIAQLARKSKAPK